MADVHTAKQPAAIPIAIGMSMIKGKNTKSEILLRTFLHAKGCRYKLHDKTILLQAFRF